MGVRWGCAVNKQCLAFLLLNHDDKIIKAKTTHPHKISRRFRKLKLQKNEETNIEEYDRVVYVEENDLDEALTYVKSRIGTTVLQYKGQRYTKKYQSKKGIRWGCAVNKYCTAFVLLNQEDKIIECNTKHPHKTSRRFRKLVLS